MHTAEIARYIAAGDGSGLPRPPRGPRRWLSQTRNASNQECGNSNQDERNQQQYSYDV
jgi:hypothetical protein